MQEIGPEPGLILLGSVLLFGLLFIAFLVWMTTRQTQSVRQMDLNQAWQSSTFQSFQGQSLKSQGYELFLLYDTPKLSKAEFHLTPVGEPDTLLGTLSFENTKRCQLQYENQTIEVIIQQGSIYQGKLNASSPRSIVFRIGHQILGESFYCGNVLYKLTHSHHHLKVYAGDSAPQDFSIQKSAWSTRTPGYIHKASSPSPLTDLPIVNQSHPPLGAFCLADALGASRSYLLAFEPGVPLPLKMWTAYHSLLQ
ncbi:MAG: hypothetical protein K2X66_07530 [Cyanobacteria bacterium]|nr:hypothetical protein [Cyanobacteriota bacterium]